MSHRRMCRHGPSACIRRHHRHRHRSAHAPKSTTGPTQGPQVQEKGGSPQIAETTDAQHESWHSSWPEFYASIDDRALILDTLRLLPFTLDCQRAIARGHAELN